MSKKFSAADLYFDGVMLLIAAVVVFSILVASSWEKYPPPPRIVEKVPTREDARPPAFTIPSSLLDITTPLWNEENLFVEQDDFWPPIPLRQGVWCGERHIYWTHGPEAALDKDGLILRNRDRQWTLVAFSQGHDYEGNDPIQDLYKAPVITRTVRCQIEEELLYPGPWYGKPFDDPGMLLTRGYRDAVCSEEVEDVSGEYARQSFDIESRVALYGFQGRLSVMVYGRDQDRRSEWDPLIIGDVLGICPYYDSHPPTYYKASPAAEERLKAWVKAKPGADGCYHERQDP